MRNALFLTLTLLSFGWVSAQTQQQPVDAEGEPIIRCHTMEAHEHLLERHPEHESLDEFEDWLAPLLRAYEDEVEQHGARMAVTTIPVIFHVIHDNDAVGSGVNLSATYINAQIDQLNNDFRRILGTSGYNTNPVGADSEIEFCPATVDPSGSTLAEPGINRINRNTVGWTAPPYGVCCGTNCFDDSYIENTIKAQSQWNPDDYFNIWVMDINCGILGYAQFPSSSGLSGLNNNGGAASTDGVVVLTSSVGSTGTPNPAGGSYNKGRTGTHEVGHFFGLRHIWGDGGCSVDDFCGDTPTSDGPNFGCPSTTSCGSVDMVENYMDYTDDDCMNIFTVDQKARMQTVLANSPRRGALGASTACGGGGPGPDPCTNTISSFPYSESFESSLGAWTQEAGDNFDWLRNSGTTPSNGTGPSAAADGTFYAYVESSSPNYPSLTTILNGPCFDLSSASNATFTFQYHMLGSAVGTLNLEARVSGGTWASVWTRSGDQGSSWLAANVDLSSYLGNTVQLRYVGTTSTSWQGDMAVDDLSLSTGTTGGSCTATVNGFPYTEGFESSFGLWTQDTGDDFNWLRNSGSTPSSNTGPSAAAEGSFYAYVESSSPNYPSQTTILNGPCFDLSAESSATFSFQYHLYGAAAMGNLVLQARGSGAWSNVWSANGNQGNAWLDASVDLSTYLGGTVELRYVGTTGTTWQGDMAVDNLSLSTGGGTGGCGDVNISITLDNYPEETSWQITDSGGAVVASGGTYAAQPDGSTVNEVACLDDGCYTFTILDAYGDGICCAYGSGSYTVTNSLGQVLASGGSFGASESTNFCLTNGNRTGDAVATPTTSTSKVLVADLELAPNPVQDQLTVRYDSKWEGTAQLQVLDLMGRAVQVQWATVTVGKNQIELSTTVLQNGTYVLLITSDDVAEPLRQSRRFVVVK